MFNEFLIILFDENADCAVLSRHRTAISLLVKMDLKQLGFGLGSHLTAPRKTSLANLVYTPHLQRK
jgi:hypothetical protein